LVHHGFERPGDGRQTDSCYGIDYPPLEISLAGLEWLIKFTSDQLSGMEETLRELPGSVQFLHPSRNAPFSLIRSTPDHSDWQWALEDKIRDLKSRVQMTRNAIATYRNTKEEWALWHERRADCDDAPKPPAQKEGPDV
jgi:hypothetical protein